jgi:nitrogen fixation NifU-like protein
MYSQQLLDHFEHPRNAGVLERPDASALIENPACGDILRLSLRLADGHIAEIRFQAKGCVASMGCASALTELVLGKSPAEARALRREELLVAVGGLPPASLHATHLAFDALNAALDQLELRA